MNIHLKPVSLRKYSVILIYSFFIMAIIAWFMEFYFEKLSGDLTRAGSFTERDFGWQIQRPAISSEDLKDYSLAEADVLVIGDSFSMSHVWQTKLAANGLKVGTMHWQDLRSPSQILLGGLANLANPLRSDLGDALRTAGFKGRYVIIESVEWLFQERMKSLSKESNPIVKHEVVINTSFPLYPFTRREHISLSKLNGVDWGVKALCNKIKLFFNSSEIYSSGNIRAIKFNGCQFFSHRLCNYSLFTDVEFEQKTFNSIANVLTVNKNLQAAGIKPIWAIVPNKSTVYLGYGALNQYPYQNIWQLFAQYPELITPDLGGLFIQKSRIIKDFYMPNDTHLSTNGFLYLGDIMLSELRKIQTNQTKPM